MVRRDGNYMIFVSRDVEFVETVFPFAQGIPTPEDRSITNLPHKELDEGSHEKAWEEDEAGVDVSGGICEIGEQGEEENIDHGNGEELVRDVENHREQHGDDLLGREPRVKRPSTRLRDYVTNTIRKLSPSSSSPVPVHNPSALYPIAHYVNCDKFSL